MGFGNSNNWQTEAVLRNERLAKQTSLDKLLEHVNWDAETLTLSLSGITLSWGDITGTDDVVKQKDIANLATKDEIPSDTYITTITKNTIKTSELTAQHLTITGDSTFSGTSININVGGASSASALPSSIKLTGNDQYATYMMALSPYELSFNPVSRDPDLAILTKSSFTPDELTLYYNDEAKVYLHVTSGRGYIKADEITCSSLSVGGSSVATKSDLSSYAKTSALSDYVKKKNNGFSQATSPSSMMCIVDGTIKYIVRSDLKSWLGIS